MFNNNITLCVRYWKCIRTIETTIDMNIILVQITLHIFLLSTMMRIYFGFILVQITNAHKNVCTHILG